MPKPEQLLIWGASGHAAVVADAVRLGGRHEVAGFLDDCDDRNGQQFCGALIVGGRKQLESLYQQGIRQIVFGFGDCHAKLSLESAVRAIGFTFATILHPSAIVASDVELGDGTFVAAGAVINTGTKVGRHVVINSTACVDHDCTLNNGCHISPGVRLAGNVSVGQCAWVGIGATVIQKRHIGQDSMIGAGAVVVRDIPPGVVAYGVPARVVRNI